MKWILKPGKFRRTLPFYVNVYPDRFGALGVWYGAPTSSPIKFERGISQALYRIKVTLKQPVRCA